MSVPFSRSLRALGSEGRSGSPAVLAVASGLLLVWLGWSVFGRVTVWAVSPDARVEVAASAAPVTAVEAGRVVQARITLGGEVHAGDVLVELDHEVQDAALATARAQVTALEAEIAAARSERDAAAGLIGTAQASGRAAVAEASARLTEAEANARIAEEKLARLTGLSAGQQVSQAEISEARATAAAARAAADALRTGVGREAAERRGLTGERTVDAAGLDREVAALEGELAAATAALRGVEEARERRTLRAPVDGRIGEAPSTPPGTWLDAGALVASVVPDGELHVVAAFSPAEALGRVRVGQPARVRLDGFPWTWYGTVSAEVTAVADEVRDGAIRVELRPEVAPGSPIPLQHGLPGTVDVEVEEVAPAALLLRAAGGLTAE